MSVLPVLDDDELQKIYVWVDSIPLTRPKRNIARDFSDGVLVAEVVHHYFPKLVELHNYSAANSLRQKLYNWGTLNQKVFKRLGYEVKRGDVEAIVNCKPGVIEAVLMQLQQKMAEYRAGHRSPGGEQGYDGGEGGSPQGYSGGQGQGLGASFSSTGSGPAHRGGRAAAAAHAILTSSEASSASSSSLQHSAGEGAPSSSSSSHAAAMAASLADRDGAIVELRETVDILELKIKKLEQLVRLKDSRIATLTARLQLGAATGGGQA